MLSSIVMDKRQLLLLCLGYSCISFNATITIRLTPVYAVQLGAQPGLTGVMVSLAFLAVTTGGIVGGWLADRTGRQRAILLISCCAWIAATYLLTHATTIPWLIFAGALLWFPGGFMVAMLNVITALWVWGRDHRRCGSGTVGISHPLRGDDRGLRAGVAAGDLYPGAAADANRHCACAL
jgi:MFS family permease